MANKANSVVVVDAGIEAPLQLAAGLAFDAEILILPCDRDGVAHVAAALQARPDTTDVYVVAHGAPGQLFLGNAELSLSTLPRYGDRLRQWTAGTQIQNIHFYGCRVAAGDAGTEFLSAIHTLTHANIAASTHLLGHADKGGDWTLDAFWGEIERRSLLTAAAISTYPGVLGNDIDGATPIAPGGPLQDGNADADAELGEPLHDPTLFGADTDSQILANDSVWWSWTSNLDGLVNINTIGSDIGTVLAVYSGPLNATSADFGSFALINTDFTAAGGATTGASVNFNAVNGVTYYFAVDGTGFQQTAGNDTGITIELDVPPVITPAQVFTIAENSPAATTLDGGGQVAVTGTADTWAITAGNPDNDGDGNAAFAIDNTGVISVNDADDLDFESVPNTYQLTVKASDAAGFSDTEAVFVQVTDVNEAPEITSLSAPGTVNEGETVTLTGQVSDPDAGDTQQVTIDWTNDGATADDVTVTVDSSGGFTATNTYADDFQGVISVTVEDEAGATGTTDPVTRNISVLNVDPAITPSIPLNFTLAEDGSQSFFLTAVDPSSVDVLTWNAGSPSNGGSLTPPVGNDPTQFFTYTPGLDFNGTETFEIQVRDDDGGLDTVQFNVTVTPEPDAPTGLNLIASDTDIDEGGSITLSGSFQDPDVGDDFTVTINWGDGTASTVLTTSDLAFNSTTNTYSFNADHLFLANDDVSVVVTVQDSDGLTDIETEAITINNLPPVVTPASTFLSIDEDMAGTIDFTATDTTATNFTWSIIDGPDNGKVSFANPTGADQTLTYTPDADFFGGDNIIIGVSDGDDVTAVNVAVIVKSVNDDPTNLVFTADDDTVNEGDTVTLSGTFDDVDNSTEPLIDDTHSITIDWGDGTIETFTEADLGIFTDTDQETVSFDNLTHIYADEGDGTYTIAVTITDEAGSTVTTTREIEVSNVAPVISGAPDTTASPLAATEDTPLNFTVKATDVGVEDVLVWSEVAAPDNGTITFGSSPENGFQNVIYTPDSDFEGTDTFTLQVSDGDGGVQNLEYDVNVTGTNDAPEILVNSFTIVEDELLNVTPLILNATDPDDTDGPGQLTFTITGLDADSFSATSFTLQDVIDGNVTFLFENEANLTDAGGNPIGPNFSITVKDDENASDTEVGNIVSFTAKNDLPILDATIDSDAVTDGVQFEFTLKEGIPQPLDANDINATDEETSDGNLSYTVTNVTGGTFFVAGVETNTFTQAQLNAGNLVFFVDDGTFTGAANDSLPAFTLTVDDGEGGVVPTTLTATFTDVVASAPVITTNTFDITEETQFQVTTAILDAEDIDTVDADLTFTIAGDASTAFLVDAGAGPVPNTTFTREDLLNNKVFFNYEGEDTPAFTITVSDGDGTSADATADGNVIDYDPVNDVPTLAINVGGVNLDEGGSFFITDTIFTFTDAEFDATPSLQGAEQIIYTYTATNGFFADAAGETITSFTQADVLAGTVVQFIQDGTPAAPSFTVTVEDNGFTLSDGSAFTASESATATVLATDFGAFNATNDAPTIGLNNFAVVEGEPLTINTSVLQVADEETLSSANLTIEITSTAANSAEVLAAFSQTTFTYQDVVLGNVTFTYEGEVEPEFEIKVTDDGRLTPAGAPAPATEEFTTVAANIVSFQNTNDAPVFVDQDGVTVGIQLGDITVTEDSFTPITTAIISATDIDLPVGGDLTYTVSNVVGGNFTLNGIDAANITTTFTQNDIESGLVFFINNGENTDEVPVGGTPDTISYDIQVSDGEDFSTASGTGTITSVDDVPTLEVNNFAVTEGLEFQVTTAQLDALDADTPDNKVRFIIRGDDKASFLFDDGVTKAADNNFTRQDILDGKIFFLYEGEDEPEFTIEVRDQTTNNLPEVDGNVTFTPTNDGPELTVTVPGATISEGGSFFIDETAFDLIDAELDAGQQTADQLVYTYTATNGVFADAAGETITSFTQADVIAGNVVQFIHDGGEDAPSFSVTLNDNGFTFDGTAFPESKSVMVDVESPTDFAFVNVNDVPALIVGNDIEVDEGQTVTITQANLNASDIETNAFDLTFVVSEITNGFISTNGGLTFEDATGGDIEFTVQDVLQSQVIFKHDDSNEFTVADLSPSFKVQVRDVGTDAGTGLLDALSPVTTVDVTLNDIDDTPVLEETFDTADDGVPFSINEGQTLLMTSTNINALDPDTPPEQLSYTVTNSVGGFFAFTQNADGSPAAAPIETNTFTQAQVNGGLVVYVHGGDNTNPSYNLKVSDGNSFDTEFYTPTLVTENDAPEITLNTLAITEDTTVSITTLNLQATDEETGPAGLTYSVDNLTNGQFLLDGVVITDSNGGDAFDLTDAFTQQDVIDQRVSFQYEGFGDAPTYTLTVTDDGTGSQAMASEDSAPSPVTVAYTAVNDAPTASDLIAPADFGIFDVTQGGVTILTKDDILVVDEEDYRLNAAGDAVLAGSPTRIVFTVDEVQNGFFSDGSTEIDPGSGLPVLAAVTEFTQDDINQGAISFIHDGSNDAPSYTLTATDQGLQVSIDETLPPEPFTFSADLAGTFTNANDAPVLGNNVLTVDEGVTGLIIGPANLSATDIETNAFDLTFNIADITNGFFTVVGNNAGVFGEGQAATVGSFSYEDVIVGNVTFTHDGTEDEPTYSVTVTDMMEAGVTGAAITTDPPEFATITFNRVNDAPTLVQADGTTALVAINVNEGGSAPVTLANIDAVDEAGETPAADLIFSISNVSGGSFIDIAGNITGTPGQALTAADTFTRANIQNGDLLFENDLDSNDSPTYTVTVTDVDDLGAENTFADFIGTLTATNDVPQQVNLGAIALTEGQPFTINSTVLSFVDEESAAADLTYTVNANDGGDFFLSSDLINAIASFTQAQVDAGDVVFVDDGNNDAPPTFSLELEDQGIPTDTNTNKITLTDADFAVADNFTPVNDLPEPMAVLPAGEFIVLPFPTVTEETPLLIDSAIINVTDEESAAADLIYTVVSVTNGSFQVGATANAITFTQADINNNLVQLIPVGEEAPTFELQLNDQGLTDGGGGVIYEPNVLTQSVTPDFVLSNEAPELTQNNLSPIEGQEVTLTTDNLAATDREDLVTQLTFEISDVVGGTFFLNDVALDTTLAGDSLGEFSILQVAAGALTFKDDGDEVLPSYKVTVIDTDGGIDGTTGPLAATIDDSNFPINDAPSIDVTVFPITEGQLLELKTTNLLSSDDDNTDAELTYTVSDVAGGDFLLFDQNTLTFNSTPNFTQQDIVDKLVGFQHDGTDTEPGFTISVSDGVDGEDSVTLSVGDGITFNEVNDAPVVVDDAFTTDEDTSLTNLAVTANDTDDSGTTLTITAIDGQASPVTTAGGAEVTIAGSALNYNPGTVFNFLAAGESATDTFTYTVTDNDVTNTPNNQTATATVTITIEGKNDAPIANADTGTAFENGAITITVLDNDSDPDTSDTLSISSVNTAGTTGVVTIDGNAINYDPTGKFTLAAGVTDTDTFSYVVDDGNGGTQTATVTVTVTGVNDLPIAADDSGVGFETDDNQVLMSLDLLANDDDPDNDTIEITQLNSSPVGSGNTITLASGAELTLNNDGTVKYDPTTSTALRGLSAGQSQTETFTYTIEDTEGGTDTATASIVVNGVNEAPTLLNDPLNFATPEGVPIDLDVLVAAGADDVDLGDTLTISNVSVGNFGIITNKGTSLTYTPGQSLTGGQVETENLTYTVSDGQGGTVNGQITIDVTGINDPPVAVADSGAGFVTNESTAFTTANVLANDFDPEGSVITLQSVDTSGVQGLIIDNGNGTFTYDPNGVFNALPVGRSTTDTFSYTISDDQGATATTNVNITVTGQLSSFFDFEQQLQLQNPAAVAPGDVIDVLPLAQLYDEAFYLDQNPDVAALVAGGVLSSGYEHFVAFGINEGRNPSVLYDEAFYLAQNPDIAGAVANGSVSSGLSHFLNVGHREDRDPSAFFDQSDYLLNNPDIAASVNNGSLASGFQHYVTAGVDENRLPDLSLFDAQFYLSNNSDLVAAGITTATAYDHFLAFGQFEGRRPSAAYSETSYLSLNPDIAAAVANGSISSGFQHYQAVGRFEGRFVLPV